MAERDVRLQGHTVSPLQFGLPRPVDGTETEEVNTAQTRYVPTTTYHLIDLTGEKDIQLGTLTLRHPEESFLASHRQKYDPKLDKVFPIRDSANPTHVHPDYADPDDPTRCAPLVSYQKAEFSPANQDKLWDFAKKNFDKQLFRTKKLLIAALERSSQQEIQATLHGEMPPGCGQVNVVPLANHGQKRRETLLAVVQIRDVPENEQFRPGYGAAFTLPADAGDPMDIDPSLVKTESFD